MSLVIGMDIVQQWFWWDGLVFDVVLCGYIGFEVMFDQCYFGDCVGQVYQFLWCIVVCQYYVYVGWVFMQVGQYGFEWYLVVVQWVYDFVQYYYEVFVGVDCGFGFGLVGQCQFGGVVEIVVFLVEVVVQVFDWNVQLFEQLVFVEVC